MKSILTLYLLLILSTFLVECSPGPDARGHEQDYGYVTELQDYGYDNTCLTECLPELEIRDYGQDDNSVAESDNYEYDIRDDIGETYNDANQVDLNCLDSCDCRSGEVCAMGECKKKEEVSHFYLLCCTDETCVKGSNCIMPDGGGYGKCEGSVSDVDIFDVEDLKDISTVDTSQLNDIVEITDTQVVGCYLSKGRFYNDCFDSSGFYPPKDGVLQYIGDRVLMFINSNFKVMVFDLQDPLMPKIVADLVMPFPEGCGLPFGCGDNHFQYEDTVWPVSTVSTGSDGYAFVPLSGYGWDILKTTITQNKINVNWMNNGYHAEGRGGPYKSGKLITQDGKIYLIGQMLDKTSISTMDKSLRIYDLGTIVPENLYEQMNTGVRIPIGKETDPPPYNSAKLSMGYIKLTILNMRESTFLVVYSNGMSTQDSFLAAFDISNPYNPIGVAYVTYNQMPEIIETLTFEADTPRLWSAKVIGGSDAKVRISGFDISYDKNNKMLKFNKIGESIYSIGSQQGAGNVYLAVDKGLMVFGWMKVGKVFFISNNGTLNPLPDENGYTNLLINLEEPCQYWDLGVGYMGLTIYKPIVGTDIYFYRSAMKEGRMIKVEDSCIEAFGL